MANKGEKGDCMFSMVNSTLKIFIKTERLLSMAVSYLEHSTSIINHQLPYMEGKYRRKKHT
jgi:hypothetical protein